jgi:hypothetical protein
VWPLTQKLLEFRLDPSSNEFFHESSRAAMLRVSVQQYGWRYSGGKELFKSFLECIIHPYQGYPYSSVTDFQRSVKKLALSLAL